MNSAGTGPQKLLYLFLQTLISHFFVTEGREPRSKIQSTLEHWEKVYNIFKKTL